MWYMVKKRLICYQLLIASNVLYKLTKVIKDGTMELEIRFVSNGTLRYTMSSS